MVKIELFIIFTQLNDFKHCYLTLVIWIYYQSFLGSNWIVLSITIYCLRKVQWLKYWDNMPDTVGPHYLKFLNQLTAIR